MSDLDLAEFLPNIDIDGASHYVAALREHHPTEEPIELTLADLLAVIAALPVETRCMVAAEAIKDTSLASAITKASEQSKDYERLDAAYETVGAELDATTGDLGRAIARATKAESRAAELESENARLKAVVDACVAWQEKFDCYFCALGSPPHAEDCPLVVGGFIEQSGGRVK